jgi:NAD(P)-dependent dehydrogenase (short-subunit alcohol dehydrogenase family)
MAHVGYRDPISTALTGGTPGIGQAIAIRFAEYGANVAINDLRAPEEATETEERVHACLARVRQKPNYLACSTSKGGMESLTQTLALEYAGQRIRVNAIAPGATVTPINRAWIDDPVKRAMVDSHIPMGRAGTADEMAGVTCFLASEAAAYITGQTIFVDGGLTLFADFREPWSSN